MHKTSSWFLAVFLFFACQVMLTIRLLDVIILLAKGGETMSISERIKQLRESKKMSQEELAKLMGYKSRSSIQKIEKGERELTRNGVVKVAQIFGVTPEYIMGWNVTDSSSSLTDSKLTPKQKELLTLLVNLKDDELVQVINYADFLKKQRKE